MEGGSGLGTVSAGSGEGSGVEEELSEGETAVGGCRMREEAVGWPDMDMDISIAIPMSVSVIGAEQDEP